MVRRKPRQIFCETLSQKKNPSTKRVSRMAQGVGPEFKPQNCKKKKKRTEKMKAFIKKKKKRIILQSGGKMAG
jgi:uncharacterized UBP type Zn finger protein